MNTLSLGDKVVVLVDSSTIKKGAVGTIVQELTYDDYLSVWFYRVKFEDDGPYSYIESEVGAGETAEQQMKIFGRTYQIEEVK